MINFKFFRKLNSRNKLLLTFGIFIVLIVLFSFFLILPSLNDLNGMQDSIETKRKEIELSYSKGNDAKQVFKKIKEIDQQIEKLNSIYITDGRQLEIITKFEDFSSKHNVTETIGINPNSDKKPSKFKKIDLTINTIGSFNNLMDYLADIESLNYYVNIYNVDISPNSSDNSSSDLMLKLGAEIYINNYN